MSEQPEIRQITELEAKIVLELAGISVPRGVLVHRDSEIAAAIELLGFPLVAKLIAPGLAHKSDIGGVRVGLNTDGAVVDAVADLFDIRVTPSLGPSGVLLEQQKSGTLELIVGAIRDFTYGPAVSVGLGGIWVESLKDQVWRLAPLSAADALEMLRDLRCWPMLSGGRGRDPVDLQAIASCVSRISELILADLSIQEIEVNPLIVGPDGATAVDALIVHSAEAGIADDGGDAREAIRRMLSPESIAVVGASKSPTAMSTRLRRYLSRHGYQGRVYLVNPREQEIDGQPCYPSLSAIPEKVDVVHILAPASAVAAAVTEAGQCGIPAGVIHASGFAEVGADGKELQDNLVRAARAAGIRLVGPNTSGVVRAASRTFTAFGMALELEHTPAGKAGLITQSGALGGSLISRGWEQGQGFSFWAATGNEADLTVSDFLNAMAEDPETGFFLLFLETIRDWSKFRAAAQRAIRAGKPVLAYKTGRTDLGRRAVQSHTGAMLGDDALSDVALHQAGVVRVTELFDLLDAAQALTSQPLPTGRRVGVISASGGACSLVADECARVGLEVPPLPEEILAQIREVVPAFGAPDNPVDVTMQYTAQPEMFTKVLDLVLTSPNIDMLLLALTTNADPPAIHVAEAVVRAATGVKPIIVARMGAEALAPKGLAVYRENGIPLFPTAERGIRVLSAMARAAESIQRVSLEK